MTDYPHSPGSQPTDTSEAAAAAIAPAAGLIRTKVLLDITGQGGGGSTADECAGRLGFSVLTVRPRVAELGKMELLLDCGRRRRNASRRNAIVWVAAPAKALGLSGIVQPGDAGA